MAHTTSGRALRAYAGPGLTLLLALCLRSAFADAGTYRGNSGLTGVYAEAIKTPLALDWKYTSNYFGYNPSSPAVVDNVVYFASGSRVYAIDASSGGIKWLYPQDRPLSTSIHGSVAVADGSVYVCAGDGKLYSIDARTGKDNWSFDTRSSIGISPTIADGVIYFGSADGRVWAIDAKTGSTVPTWKGGVKLLDELSGPPAVAAGFVYALSSDNVLHAIGTATGKERWFYRFNGSVNGMSPVVQGDYLYIANGGNLTSLGARNGLHRWTQILGTDIATSPAVTEDTIYVVTSDDRVLAFEPRFGKQRWKNPPKLDFDVIAPPTVAGNTLFIGATQGALFALDKDTGATNWTYMVAPSSTSDTAIAPRTNIAAAPVVANGSLYILTDDGSVSAFRADATDTLGPTVSNAAPEMGVVINGAPPLRFEARIQDEGSGVNADSLKLMIDGQGVPRKPDGARGENKPGYVFETDTGMLRYTTEEPNSAATVRNLPDGRHTVTVVAADWKGNTTTKSWSFTVDNSLAKLSTKKPSDSTSGYPGGARGPGGMGPGGMGPGGRGPGGRGGGGPGGRGRGGAGAGGAG